MSSFAQARSLAEKWVELISDDSAEIVRHLTIAKPYGWVFFWQSSAALRDPDNFSLRLLGNGPIVVFRDSLELKLLTTARHVDHSLRELEAQMTQAVLSRRPEHPTW